MTIKREEKKILQLIDWGSTRSDTKQISNFTKT